MDTPHKLGALGVPIPPEPPPATPPLNLPMKSVGYVFGKRKLPYPLPCTFTPFNPRNPVPRNVCCGTGFACLVCLALPTPSPPDEGV